MSVSVRISNLWISCQKRQKMCSFKDLLSVRTLIRECYTDPHRNLQIKARPAAVMPGPQWLPQPIPACKHTCWRGFNGGLWGNRLHRRGSAQTRRGGSLTALARPQVVGDAHFVIDGTFGRIPEDHRTTRVNFEFCPLLRAGPCFMKSIATVKPEDQATFFKHLRAHDVSAPPFSRKRPSRRTRPSVFCTPNIGSPLLVATIIPCRAGEGKTAGEEDRLSCGCGHNTAAGLVQISAYFRFLCNTQPSSSVLMMSDLEGPPGP